MFELSTNLQVFVYQLNIIIKNSIMVRIIVSIYIAIIRKNVENI